IEQRTLQFSLPSPRETQQPERVANGTSAMATKIRENVRPTNRVNSGILGNIFRRQETPPDSIRAVCKRFQATVNFLSAEVTSSFRQTDTSLGASIPRRIWWPL